MPRSVRAQVRDGGPGLLRAGGPAQGGPRRRAAGEDRATAGLAGGGGGFEGGECTRFRTYRLWVVDSEGGDGIISNLHTCGLVVQTSVAQQQNQTHRNPDNERCPPAGPEVARPGRGDRRDHPGRAAAGGAAPAPGAEHGQAYARPPERRGPEGKVRMFQGTPERFERTSQCSRCSGCFAVLFLTKEALRLLKGIKIMKAEIQTASQTQ